MNKNKLFPKYLFIWVFFGISNFYPPTMLWAESIEVNNNWGGVFSGVTTPLEITLSKGQYSNLDLHWKLLSKGRVLTRGKKEIVFDRNEKVDTTILLRPPHVRDGVNVKSKLIIYTKHEQNEKEIQKAEIDLLIFGQDVLLSSKDILKKIEIRLFDPKGITSNMFNRVNVPYSVIDSIENQEPSISSLIVIGHGVDFDLEIGLIDLLRDLAAHGQQILVFQPASISMSVSNMASKEIPYPSNFSLFNKKIIRTITNKYDWLTNPNDLKSAIDLQVYRQSVIVTISSSVSSDWSWFQENYDSKGGRLIICTLPFYLYVKDNPIVQIILGEVLLHSNKSISSQPPVYYMENAR